MLSFKKLIPSFLLVLLYVIADEFFSPLLSLLCILFLGIAEFLYTRFREKTTDRLVIWLTLLFCLPAALELWGANTGLLPLQSVLLEAGLCLLLGIVAFSRANPLNLLPASARKEIHLTSGMQRSMKKILQVLCYLLVIHIVLALFAFSRFSPSVFAFVSGPLLYITVGLFLLMLWFRKYRQVRNYRREEWLPLVNEKGEVTGKAPRSLCHSGSKLLHPVVHLQIINENKEIFLQKRSMKKDLLPGKWDTAVGGHIGLNEKVEEALKRETFEELGITNFEVRFNGSYLWESPREKELVFSFLCTGYDRIHIDNEEVDEGRFWTKREIEAQLRKEIFTPNFIYEYHTLLRQYLA